MKEKYKLSEFAKDVDMTNKELAELLAQHGIEGKKTSSILTPGELDILFNVLVNKHEKSNFNSYFALARKKKTVTPKVPASSVPQAGKQKTEKKEKKTEKVIRI